MRAGDRAWIILGVGVVAYEVSAAEGELMSEAADRWLEHHPWLVRAAVFLLAAHIANALDPRYDPVHRLHTLRRRTPSKTPFQL